MNQPEGIELSPELEEKCRAELEPDEKVIWAQRPVPWLYGKLLGQHILGTVFLRVAACCVLYIAAAGLSMFALGIKSEHPRWPIFVIALALYFLCGLTATTPIWMKRIARRTAYVVTTRRVIIFQGRIFSPTTVDIFIPGRLTSMRCEERPDGNGDLIFEQFEQPAGSGTTTVRRGFIAINNVRHVERLIVENLLSKLLRPLE